MALFAKKSTIPAQDEALPGRNTPLPITGKHFVNGSNIKQPATGGLEEAVFGLGCFWGAERKFWQIPGVVTTAVGYAGGHTPNATYEEVCSGRTGHTEVVRVVYDPNKVSYETLLKAFWESHDPTQGMRQGNDVGTQYRSAIYWTTDAQKKAAEEGKRALPGSAGQGASRDDHHRNPGGAGVLLRRGISPAVPGEESEWVLRAGRVRSFLREGVIRSASHAPLIGASQVFLEIRVLGRVSAGDRKPDLNSLIGLRYHGDQDVG